MFKFLVATNTVPSDHIQTDLARKALPCGPCGETVWSDVTSSTTSCGMIWFFCFICCCCPCAFLPFWMKNFKKFHHKCSKCGNNLETVYTKWSKTKICIIIVIGCFIFLLNLILPLMGLKYLGIV